MHKTGKASSRRDGDDTPRCRSEIVEEFIRAARAAEDRDRLRQVMGEAVLALGFEHFVLQGEGARLWLADAPPNWIFHQDPECDPVWKVASHSLTPFLWSDAPRLVALSSAETKLFAAAPPAFSARIHPPALAASGGGICGCASFLVRKGARLPAESFAAAHYIGAFAHNTAQRLLRGQTRPVPPRLTPRQRDCMMLAAQGKSDWEIGTLLGISESTVHKHIEDAKRRFGVSTRIQLVVRSLADARFSFADVLAKTPRPSQTKR